MEERRLGMTISVSSNSYGGMHCSKTSIWILNCSLAPPRLVLRFPLKVFLFLFLFFIISSVLLILLANFKLLT